MHFVALCSRILLRYVAGFLVDLAALATAVAQISHYHAIKNDLEPIANKYLILSMFVRFAQV